VKLNEAQHHPNIRSSVLRRLQGYTPPHRKHGWPGRATDPSGSCALVRTACDDNWLYVLDVTDSKPSYWILLPITIVMILTGILRHYLSTLLQSTPKRQLLAKIREQRSLGRAQNLRNNYQQVSKAAFERRKEAFLDGTKEGKFLADPDAKNKPKPNPMSDPAMMEGMMGMMKGNVAMMVPQSLIMGWINAFFSGYVISMLLPTMRGEGCLLIYSQ
jgi:hypothetical protein